MLQPVGPLPPEVYWRRRAVAVAGLVVALVLLLWIGSAVAGGSPTPTGSAAAASSTTTAAPATTPAASTPPAPAAGTTTTTVPAPAATTTTAPAAAPPAPCPDASVALTAQVAEPSYPVGQEPVFRLLVSNSSAAPCTRALDAGLQQVLVYSADGATRLWSSNDCFPGTGTETKTLNPGEQTAYSVRWSGATSAPGCTAPRTPVPAGSYTVVVALGGITSAPVAFTLT